MQSDSSWRETGATWVTSVEATPAMRSCLERVYRSALIRLGIATGVPLMLVAIAIVAGNFLFAAFGFIVVVGLNTPRVALRVHRLHRAQTDPSIVRVRGPVAVTKHRRHGSESYGLYYKAWVKRSSASNDWQAFDIDEAGFRDVAEAATVVPDDRPGLWKIFSAVWRHEVSDAISTYSPTGHLLLDVRYPAGGTIYCHRDYEGEGWAD